MSQTVYAPFKQYGPGGDYPVEINYAVRIYDNKGETIPKVGEISASLKGGQRTNHHGKVPILNGKMDTVGWAEIIKIVSYRPEHADLADIKACGFDSVEAAVDYVKKEHATEFDRDNVLTVFYFKVVELF